ncbi:hypothetical protein KB553_14550 [Chryseobacterium rhizoplanae]|uniref:hypothetical protein n=1 Tax=Chryseobacterium rhizoplanae TaxID=1609531 RepID=UPI001CE298FF|nr:hypothetical protein [Chryseobacterium rhizoplanae]UCA58270.1 hypothetical protein KB553_14550 [Chryseobacterium rhizoplanae]
MKKQIKKEKKLSLNKVRLMKITEMKTISGGSGAQAGLNFNGDDDHNPTIRQTMGQQ